MELHDEDIKAFPVLSFWYGLSYSELMEMPKCMLRLYAEALPGLIAEYQAMHVTAASYPYMTKERQRAVQRRLNQSMRGRGEARRPKLSRSSFRTRMTALGFGWRDVPSKKQEENE